MRPALSLILTALLLPACGGSASSATSRSDASPGGGTPAASVPPPAPGATQPTAASEPAPPTDPAAADEPGAQGINEILQGLDGLPTQDELDAAAAARITEATADAEYEKLKAEIEADMANPGGGG